LSRWFIRGNQGFLLLLPLLRRRRKEGGERKEFFAKNKRTEQAKAL
jgi:hypothetical protein